MSPRSLFPNSLHLDPATDPCIQLHAIPARHAVALLLADQDKPLQILAGRNIRAALLRRLQPPPDDQPRSRRVDYRPLLRQVLWCPVHSAFEEDWLYYLATRRFFPNWRELVKLPDVCFVHVDPNAEFPRWLRIAPGTAPAGIRLGPIPEKKLADQLIQIIEDVFDLCRYHHILVEAPNGKACAYKEMGRCPAPCDGSESLQSYRRRIADSAAAILDPDAALATLQAEMSQAAASLAFERAAAIKRRLDALSRLKDKRFRSLSLGRSGALFILAPGPRPGCCKLLLCRDGRITPVVSLIAPPADDAAGLLLLPPPGPPSDDPETDFAAAILCMALTRNRGPIVTFPADHAGLPDLCRSAEKLARAIDTDRQSRRRKPLPAGPSADPTAQSGPVGAS